MPEAVGTDLKYNFYELCPIPVEIKSRKQYKLDENETPSIADEIFASLRNKSYKCTAQTLARVFDDNQNIEDSKDSIETHVDRRIASFFEQLIVCYKVPYHFEIGETMHQAESTPTLTIKRGNNTKKIPFDSAHSSTLPCLYAYR